MKTTGGSAETDAGSSGGYGVLFRDRLTRAQQAQQLAGLEETVGYPLARHRPQTALAGAVACTAVSYDVTDNEIRGWLFINPTPAVIDARM